MSINRRMGVLQGKTLFIPQVQCLGAIQPRLDLAAGATHELQQKWEHSLPREGVGARIQNAAVFLRIKYPIFYA